MTGTHSVQRFPFRLIARNEAAEHPEVMGSNPAGGEALSVLTLMQLYDE